MYAYGDGYGYGNTAYAQQNLQIQMASNPMYANMMPSGVINGSFMFTGSSIQLPSRIEAVQPQELSTVRDINVTIMGTQVKEYNVCCMIITIVFGSILIFPLCFMCCGWWQRLVYPAFEVEEHAYRSLEKLFSSTNLNSVTITVVDNAFNRSKANIIYEMLSRSCAKAFIFNNSAGPYNYNESEYDDFKSNVSPIKSLSISANMRWYT